MSAQRILVVDDDPAIRRLLSRILQKAGYAVETAGDGQEGLDMLEQSKYDLVLSDVGMPSKNGPDFYEEAEGKGNKTPFLFVYAEESGSLAHKRVQELVRDKKVKKLHKPFTQAQLLEAVTNALLNS